VIDSSDEGFEQPSDEDAQGNVLTMRQMDIDREDGTTQTPNKQDAKPEAEEEEQVLPSTERQDRRSRKHDYETEKMKKILAVFTTNTQKTTKGTGRETCNRNRCNEANRHGNTKPRNNQNYASTAIERSQSVRTFHRDDQTM
jgi:hypothetical protein